MSVRNLFVILTPFQYRMMKQIFPDKMVSGDTLIIHTQHVILDESLHKGVIKKLDYPTFSFLKLKQKPLSMIFRYQKLLNRMAKDCERIMDTIAIEELNVIIGSEKDNFTQVFLNKLYHSTSSKPTLHAVEEGLGYYVKEDLSDRIKKGAYKILSPILFGRTIHYHRQLGTDKRIDEVYVRLPEMIPEFSGKESKTYHKIKLTSSTGAEEVSGQDVLVFSFPNADYGVTREKKHKIYKELTEKFTGRNIVIKPHPREETDVFKEFPTFRVLERSVVGEDLNYFQYGAIVNFSSSVIIDILAQGYPLERIITISISPIPFPLFEKTNYIAVSELKHLEFEA